MSYKKKILIVDDSIVIQKLLFSVLSTEPDFEIVGICADPFEAKDYISTGQVDCMILDLEMPKMDGLTFMKKIMSSLPLPIIILSSAVEGNTELETALLKNGAFGVFSKPYGFDQVFFGKLKQKIRESRPSVNLNTEPIHDLILIAASTGGTEGVKKILKGLSKNMTTPIIVIQHMAEQFTKSFAETLNKMSPYYVKEAVNGELIEKATAYIAPGNFHLEIKNIKPGQYRIETNQKPYMHSVRPAADVTFLNLSPITAKISTVVILSGMGKDGADGIAYLKTLGSKTIAESEESCVVFGMPKAAIATGKIDQVLSIEQITLELNKKYQNEKVA